MPLKLRFPKKNRFVKKLYCNLKGLWGKLYIVSRVKCDCYIYLKYESLAIYILINSKNLKRITQNWISWESVNDQTINYPESSLKHMNNGSCFVWYTIFISLLELYLLYNKYIFLLNALRQFKTLENPQICLVLSNEWKRMGYCSGGEMLMFLLLSYRFTQ